MRRTIGIIAALALCLFTSSNAARADSAALLGGPWSDYYSTSIDMAQTQDGWNALIVRGPEMDHGEVVLVRFLNPLNPADPSPTQWQGTVVYDSGWIGTSSETSGPFFTLGGTVLFSVTTQSDKLIVANETNPFDPWVFCGPNARKQIPPPVSNADVRPCAAL